MKILLLILIIFINSCGKSCNKSNLSECLTGKSSKDLIQFLNSNFNEAEFTQSPVYESQALINNPELIKKTAGVTLKGRYLGRKFGHEVVSVEFYKSKLKNVVRSPKIEPEVFQQIQDGMSLSSFINVVSSLTSQQLVTSVTEFVPSSIPMSLNNLSLKILDRHDSWLVCVREEEIKFKCYSIKFKDKIISNVNKVDLS